MPNPRKPTAQKIIEGTYRADRAVENEIKPPVLLNNKAPDMLNEWGQQLWLEIMKANKKIGLVTKFDVASLMAMCIEWGTYQEAHDLIKELQIEEDVYDQRGNVCGTRWVVNPLIKVRDNAYNNYVKMCKEFGCTPSSRAGLSMPEEKAKDKFSQFDKRKK